MQPRLVEHVELTVYAVTIGFGLALAAALVAYRYRRFEAPFGLFSELLYTIPSLALFQLLVPITGLTVTTVEVALVSYTLLILFRNALTGLQTAPHDVLEAAPAMGLTRAQALLRVELPLAVPSMVAGIRIATVSTISLATIAAFVVPEGLGQPILDGLQIGFNTKFVAAGALAVALAIAVDALLALLQRALTPWTRAGRPA